MAEVDRWVVIDETEQTIVGGPYLWDGTTNWTPPEQGLLVLEADALADGYTYPDS